MIIPPYDNRPASAAARAPRTWDFMETLFVALAAYAVFGITGWLAYAGLVAAHDSVALSPAVLRRLDSAASIISCGPTIAVLWIAVRRVGRGLSEYLALNWPRRDELLPAVMIVFTLWVVEFAISPAVEPPTDLYGVLGGVTGLFLFFVALTITAPIMEEFVCRGFMFRGWSESFLGPTGAIVLISAIWAALHVQSSWWERFWIFLLGLALGYFRWRNHSTWLAVVCHSAINVLSFLTLGARPLS
jgi:membrane protease YdiL (CAAX protease family)